MKKLQPKQKKLTPVTGNVVVVDWEDAWVNALAFTNAAKAIEEPALMVKSTGFFVAQDKKGIMLATQYSEGTEFRGPHFIPAGMIRKVTLL